MEDFFTRLRWSNYYIDKSLSLRGILEGRHKKFLFTRPCRWGKTTFQQMMRDFLSISVDNIGKEIENESFIWFENLKVVTEDRVNIEDLLFLLQNYTNNEIIEQEIEKISDYFQKRNYPWFIQIKDGLSQLQKLERIQRLYARAKEGFSYSEEEFKKWNKQQITEHIENLRINSPNNKQYYKLLSTFGETCKHFQKYPTIFVQFPTVFNLQYLSSASVYNVNQESIIKHAISHAFDAHSYQEWYLEAQIRKNENSNKRAELKTFKSYLNSNEDPSDSLTFLSKSLFSRYQIPTVLIVDDYDKPMNSAIKEGETRYNQVKECIVKILACINNEESIHYVSLTGINISKANILPGLNNDFAERNILDFEYADCFGLAASDAVEIVNKYNQINKQNQDYEDLKRWHKHYQIDGTVCFDPYSVHRYLQDKGKFSSYYKEQFYREMIIELFKKMKVGREEIALSLLNGEVEFCPLGSFSWEDMQDLTIQQFLSYLLHTGYLSLAPGEIVERYTMSKFVVQNKEIRTLIDNRLMHPFYEMILENKCQDFYRCTESAGTNNFTQNLNEDCLTNISYSENNIKTEAYFESVILGIFYIVPSGIYYVEAQKALNRRKLNFIFYPGQGNQENIAVLHGYKVCEVTDNKEEKALDAIWLCLTRNYLTCVSDGKMIIDDEIESIWSRVKLRGIVFYPNMDTFKWCAASVEYTLSLKKVKDILEIFSCFENKQNAFREELLSGKQGTRAQIENERTLFLKEHKAENLSALIKSTPFKYQQTPSESKIKAGFSSVKLDFYPLSDVNYLPFDPSKCYPLSAVNSWRLQTTSHSSFKVLDVLLVLLCFNFSICLQPTQQRSSLLKASPFMRSLKLLSKFL